MNEAGGVTEGIEAYLRHTMTLSRRPKLIVKDTQMADKRRDLLKSYAASIQDTVVLHSDPAVRPFLDRKENWRPEGFQSWRKFGSPPGAPGQALHHPAVKEHEFLGWVLAMHFLSALELVAAATDVNVNENTKHPLHFSCPAPSETKQESSTNNLLPPPVTVNVTDMKEWSSLFFGVPNTDSKLKDGRVLASDYNQAWRMNPVHCRTSYEPIVDQLGSLSSIVVSGSTGEDMDLMLPKGHFFYNKAWVMDLSEGEKDAKRKLDRFGGLGFVDAKKAYRGLFNSGTLRFLLPYYPNTEGLRPKSGDKARDWFQNVIVCEVNERREPSVCQNGKDITFKAGGANATEITMLDTPGTLYLGKKICAHVKIPEDATIISREEMLLEDPLLRASERKQLTQEKVEGKTLVGLSLDLTVHNHLIIARDKACSVSHVVWEVRTPGDIRFPIPNIAPTKASTKPNKAEKREPIIKLEQPKTETRP